MASVPYMSIAHPASDLQQGGRASRPEALRLPTGRTSLQWSDVRPPDRRAGACACRAHGGPTLIPPAATGSGEGSA